MSTVRNCKRSDQHIYFMYRKGAQSRLKRSQGSQQDVGDLSGTESLLRLEY